MVKQKIPLIVLVFGSFLSPAFGQHVFQVESLNRATGYLGVSIRDLDEEDQGSLGLSQDLGVYVLEVVEDSPASRAGVQPADIIVEYAGIAILGARQFTRLVSETSPGRTLELTVVRNGRSRALPVEIGEREGPRWIGEAGDSLLPRFRFERAPQLKGGSFAFERKPELGIKGVDLTAQMARFLGVSSETGVLILEVSPSSAAARAGLEAGDVIVSVDGRKITGMGQLRERLSKEELALVVVRQKEEQSITVDLGEKAGDSFQM